MLLLLLVVVGALLSAAPPARAEEAFRLQVRTPPAGMTTDHERSRYWLLDKASGRLALTALAEDGTVQGRMTSRDSLVDAAGIAYDAGELYVADIGGPRSEVTVLQIVEPWPGTDILKAVPFVLTYPDGKQEGTAILLGRDGRLHLVTGGETPGIYEAPMVPSSRAPNPLTRIADAPAGVTDGTVLSDGRWVLRTDTAVLTLDPQTHAVLGQTDIGTKEQGQVLTQALSGPAVLTAVGAQGLVTRTAVPGPQPTTAPAPARTRAAAPRPDTARGDAGASALQQAGTMLALGAAAVVAVLVGFVVLIRR